MKDIMKEPNARILTKLAYRYWKRDKSLMAEVCWQKAEKLLLYIGKRKSLMKRMMK